MTKEKITGRTAAEIVQSVRNLLDLGKLRPGDLLPTVREVANALAVNRNTVALAYTKLVSAGVAQADGRRGTTIASRAVPGPREGTTSSDALMDLSDGNPSPELLPELTDLVRPGRSAVLYGAPAMLPQLAPVAAKLFAETDCPTSRSIDVTHGAVDALERLVAACLGPNEKVAVEDPCFLGTINALRLSGMEAVAVAMDEHGMHPQALEKALKEGCRAVLITPRAQNPTGVSLTVERAAELRRVLTRHPAVMIIVDDHFSLLAEGAFHSPIPKGAPRWSLIRSLSKALGPDLRVAIVASDPDTSEQLRLRLTAGATWVSHLLQGVALEALTSKVVQRKLAVAKRRYGERRKAMIQGLKALDIRSPTADGLNVWAPLGRPSGPVIAALREQGWGVRDGADFQVTGEVLAIRVTVSQLTKRQIERFLADFESQLGRG